jgi:hypothetical protein
VWAADHGGAVSALASPAAPPEGSAVREAVGAALRQECATSVLSDLGYDDVGGEREWWADEEQEADREGGGAGPASADAAGPSGGWRRGGECSEASRPACLPASACSQRISVCSSCLLPLLNSRLARTTLCVCVCYRGVAH